MTHMFQTYVSYLNISIWYPWRLDWNLDWLAKCRVMQKAEIRTWTVAFGINSSILQFLCCFVFLVRYISPFTKTLHFILNVTGRCYNCSGTSHLAGQCPSSRRRAKRNRASKGIVVVHHNHYYQTRAGVNNPWGVPHRSINSSITQRGERLSVTTTTSTLTICRPIPIRPSPIHPTLPITT